VSGKWKIEDGKSAYHIFGMQPACPVGRAAGRWEMEGITHLIFLI